MVEQRYVSEGRSACISLADTFLQILKYRDQLLGLVSLLVEKTKSERGYTGTGRLINRILHSAATIYSVNSRFVNPDEWDSPGELRQTRIRPITLVLTIRHRVQPELDHAMGQDVQP